MMTEANVRNKTGLLLFFALLATVAFTATAWAAGVGLTATGAPTTAKQGETKTFTINVAATGSINLDKIPATVTVNSAYTAGGGSGTPNSSSVFNAPATNPPCETYASGPHRGECKPAQSITGGPYAIGASVIVPADLVPGLYTITMAASVGDGLDLPNPMPSFDIEVLPAGAAPSVTIDDPANGETYKVNQPVTASVEIQSDLPLTSITASLNGGVVFLDYNSTNDRYEAPVTLSKPGANTFTVEACNSIGCGDATSTFTVKYDFGGWLPPVTTAKFQSGRTLPVKFTVNDYYGPTPNAVAMVGLDGSGIGQAEVLFDSYGVPYYQLEVKLDVAAGPHSIDISLDDSVTNVSKLITVK